MDLLSKFAQVNESEEFTVSMNWGCDKKDEVMRVRGEEIAIVVN